MKTTDLISLEEQIAQAERDVDAAQNRYRSRPRGAVSLGLRPIIDREARPYA
jgi:hypothetical protein